MIKVGIVGATGYAGVELIRLLLAHPEVEITRLTSRTEAGVRVDHLYNLRSAIDLAFEDPAGTVRRLRYRVLQHLMPWR